MARLIDADKFIEKVKKDREHECYLHSWTADDVLKRLDSWYAPTVDAIPISVLEDIKAEIKEWYWQADKQAIAKDPCVVDAMVDLFIRTINKHMESEDKEQEDGNVD